MGTNFWQKGRTPWNKGIKMPPEIIAKVVSTKALKRIHKENWKLSLKRQHNVRYYPSKSNPDVVLDIML